MKLMSQSEPLLPKVVERRDYVSPQQETALWLPAMRVICQRHNLSVDTLLRLGDGTNVVFAGEDCIIKLFPPYWQREVQRIAASPNLCTASWASPPLKFEDMANWRAGPIL